jgi:hypothetical protein
MMINDILYFYALHADPLLIQRIQPSPLVIIDKPLIVTTTERKEASRIENGRLLQMQKTLGYKFQRREEN